ncbi:MAG: GatB/YqeY domain-containing protein [Bacilli bacterium]|nr:GatB/YqeY domain-containing protein [Bacilli bacterium]MDD4298066.1 GatB/YqeY domain-containing protein [Bacilli bacterium]
MSLMDIIVQDMKEAMRSKNRLYLDVIRMVKGAIQLEEINRRKKLEEADIVDIISKQIKMRRESIEEFKKANRLELITQTESEIDILNKYLPEQLSDNELLAIIDSVILKVNAKSISDISIIMKELVPLIKGKADMKKVNSIIKQKLSIQ